MFETSKEQKNYPEIQAEMIMPAALLNDLLEDLFPCFYDG